MMRDIHKSKYTQAIPGISRIDKEISFIHGERCFSHIGDGLHHPDKLIAAATNAQQRGRHAKVWCEQLNATAESRIRDAFTRKELKLQQWKEHLNEEIDNLATEIEKLGECERDLQKRHQYFKDLSRASSMTSKFRSQLKDHEPNDRIENLGKEERTKLDKAENDVLQQSREIKDIQKKLEDARDGLMSEVEMKAMTINVGRRCQNTQPIPGFPYRPEDHPVDQIYHPNSEEDWERNLEIKHQNAVALRREAEKIRCRTANIIQDDISETSDAWKTTTKAIYENVQEDERTLYNIHSLLKTINDNMSSTKQRIATLCDDVGIQERCRTTQLWRLQNLTYRPGHEHIRDEPVLRLDEEVSGIQKKTTFLDEGIACNRNLLQELNEEKNQQTINLEKITQKLFIERENCLGLRRTLQLDED